MPLFLTEDLEKKWLTDSSEEDMASIFAYDIPSLALDVVIQLGQMENIDMSRLADGPVCRLWVMTILNKRYFNCSNIPNPAVLV